MFIIEIFYFLSSLFASFSLFALLILRWLSIFKIVDSSHLRSYVRKSSSFCVCNENKKILLEANESFCFYVILLTFAARFLMELRYSCKLSSNRKLSRNNEKKWQLRQLVEWENCVFVLPIFAVQLKTCFPLIYLSVLYLQPIEPCFGSFLFQKRKKKTYFSCCFLPINIIYSKANLEFPGGGQPKGKNRIKNNNNLLCVCVKGVASTIYEIRLSHQ